MYNADRRRIDVSALRPAAHYTNGGEPRAILARLFLGGREGGRGERERKK